MLIRLSYPANSPGCLLHQHHAHRRQSVTVNLVSKLPQCSNQDRPSSIPCLHTLTCLTGVRQTNRSSRRYAQTKRVLNHPAATFHFTHLIYVLSKQSKCQTAISTANRGVSVVAVRIQERLARMCTPGRNAELAQNNGTCRWTHLG